ncbi:MAG: hypothetical protein ACRCWR_10145 [Saezia sp.]
MFTAEELKIFAENYTKNDLSMILCDSEAPLANYDFRITLSEFAVANINSVSVDLIADLYLENAKSSKHTFSVYKNLNVLAQKLLAYDWRAYLDVYMEGAMKSFDTFLCTGNIRLERKVAAEIYEYLMSLPKDKKVELFIEQFKYLMTV